MRLTGLVFENMGAYPLYTQDEEQKKPCTNHTSNTETTQ
jgi:hypothetical protein